MWRKAPRTLRSRPLSRMKSHAVKPLTRTPTPAVQAMASPVTASGWSMRPMLSATITPTAMSRMSELSNEMSTVLFL